jgi:regulator of RNase E activity RraA
VRGFDIPVYSRAINPMAGFTRRLFETQVPVRCGGVDVSPGDVMFGDDDGIVVGAAEQFADLIPAAEAIQRTEEDVFARLERGESLIAMLNFEEHCRNVLAGKESRLRFG